MCKQGDELDQLGYGGDQLPEIRVLENTEDMPPLKIYAK
jgi:hypothetical protein